MPDTITRDGAILPVQVRTARTPHACNDCPEPIMPGDRYELTAYPPHRVQEFDVPVWLTWRSHHPRHDGHRFLAGCDAAAAYHEQAVRVQLEVWHG